MNMNATVLANTAPVPPDMLPTLTDNVDSNTQYFFFLQSVSTQKLVVILFKNLSCYAGTSPFLERLVSYHLCLFVRAHPLQSTHERSFDS